MWLEIADKAQGIQKQVASNPQGIQKQVAGKGQQQYHLTVRQFSKLEIGQMSQASIKVDAWSVSCQSGWRSS